jgi:hypothetical protein
LNLNQDTANKSKWFVVTFCLALLCALVAPRAMMADEADQATKLTFTEAVEVPGQVLPAGTYWFTVANSDADRHLVQIWNADRIQLLTTILAIPDYRTQPKGETVVHFEERPSAQPEAIHSWFYPGSDYGEEFVYPKSRAIQLAAQTRRPVLSMANEQVSDPAQITQAAVKAMNPSSEEIEIADVVATHPVMPQEAASDSLPTTASAVAGWGLLGLLSLASGFVLRVVAQRMA